MEITANNKFGSYFESVLKSFSRCKTVSCPKIASVFTQWKTARPRLETGSASKPIDPKTTSLLYSSYLAKTAALLALPIAAALVWSLKTAFHPPLASTIVVQPNTLQNTFSNSSLSADLDRSLASLPLLNSCPDPNRGKPLNADQSLGGIFSEVLYQNVSNQASLIGFEHLDSEPTTFDKRTLSELEFPLDQRDFMQQGSDFSENLAFKMKILFYRSVNSLIIHTAPRLNRRLKSEAIDDYVDYLETLIPREQAKIRSQKEWEHFVELATARFYLSAFSSTRLFHILSGMPLQDEEDMSSCTRSILASASATSSIFSLYASLYIPYLMFNPKELNVYFFHGKNLDSEPVAFEEKPVAKDLQTGFMQQMNDLTFKMMILFYRSVNSLILTTAPPLNRFLQSEAIDKYVDDLRSLIPREQAKIRSQEEWMHYEQLTTAQLCTAGWIPALFFYLLRVPSRERTFLISSILSLWSSGFMGFYLYRMFDPKELNVYFSKETHS